MPSKKEIILNYYNEGKSVEQIFELEPTFRMKYIKEVIKNANKSVSKTDFGDKSNSPYNADDIVQIKADILEIKKSLEAINLKVCQKNSKKKVNSSKKSLSDLIKVLEIFQNNEQLSKNISIDVQIYINNEDMDNLKDQTIANEIEVLNPIEAYRKIGKEELRKELFNYDIAELREIVKRYAPDPRGYATKWKNIERIIDYIVERAESLSQKGNVFITD